MENDILDQIENSEFENVSGLLGDVSEEELLAVAKRNPKKLKRVVSKASTKVKSSGATNAVASAVPQAASRSEFEARFTSLKPELKQGLLNKTMQLSDTVIYVTKSIDGAKTVKMFEDSDNKLVGVSNISSAKLEKNEVFLCSGIQVLYGKGTSTGNTQTNVATVPNWELLPHFLECGEFTFRASGKTLIDKMSNSVFKNYMTEKISNATSTIVGGTSFGDGNLPGFYKLANPKLIETQQAIEFTLEWLATAPQYSYIRVNLFGTKIMKY